MILPTTGAVLRRLLEQWFEENDIHPRIVAEFQDAAQLKSFGEMGLGIFPAPAIIADEVTRQHLVEEIGEIYDVFENFYAISIERRIKHPAVVAIIEGVQIEVFGTDTSVPPES